MSAGVDPEALKAKEKTVGHRELFDACDDDRDGLVSLSDLEATLRKLAGRHDGSRALFATHDKDGDGALEYEEFVRAISSPRKSSQQEPSSHGGADAAALPSSAYFRSHDLPSFLLQMTRRLDDSKPENPFLWMMEYLAKHRPISEQSSASAISGAAGNGHRGPAVRVNISAVLRKPPHKLLQRVVKELDWKAVEEGNDSDCHIYFTWNSRSFLARIGHPSCTAADALPPSPASAWVNRWPGMGHLCDKVNMALALRLMQKIWTEKFNFWPKSWLLPAECDQLRAWLNKHKGTTVIVKPADGSLGDGIFMVQNTSDLDAKLLAKPSWGAGFSALAQKYIPNPLLIDGLKFDLRLYVVLTSTDPLKAYLCREGLARFCTKKYEEPTAANANQQYMHLTNYSLNKKSAGFTKASDPSDVDSQASKRPLSILLRQIEAQEAAQGRVFDQSKFYRSCEEVVVVLLQSMAPVLKVTYDRVSKESKPKPKPKAKRKSKPRNKLDTDSDDEGDDHASDSACEEDEHMPNCFQILGVDVLMDESLQPWLLEVNGRPSMDVDEPVRLDEAPEGSRKCTCRDMDGEEHAHLLSAVDMFVKSQALKGAFEIIMDKGLPSGYSELKFEEHGPVGDLGGTMQLISRLYQVAGGGDKAFTTSGLRRALAGAIKLGLNPIDLDSAVSRWKHQGYRRSGEVEKDTAEIGVLDFASLLQEVAMLGKDPEEEDALDALTSLIDDCDPDD